MISIGAVFGGLFLGLRALVPYLAAKRSGVIVRKGDRGLRIRRDEDSDGFERLLANRAKAAVAGLGLSAAGLLVLSFFGLAVSGGSGAPLAILYLAVFAGFTLVASYCLVRGLATGRMFAFWSLAVFGGVTRKQNPTFFWVYTALNVWIVANGTLVLLRAFG